MLRRIGLIGLMVSLSGCGGGTESPSDTGITGHTAIVPAATSACAGVDIQSRPALHRSAQEGSIPPDVPGELGPAVAGVPSGLFTAVLYVGCYSEVVDDLSFERMVWTNGIGLLLVSAQEWPGDGAQVNLPLPGKTRQAGIVQVSTIDEMAAERTRMVHLFDGVRVVTVATFSLTTLSIEQVEEMAWAIYDGLPVESPTRAGVGVSRTLADFIAVLPSPQIPISDPAGVDELSPFATGMALAHATYRFTAAGSVVTVFDFGAVGAADRAAAAVSSDGYTIARLPYDVVATPHYWQWDRLIIQYMGNDTQLVARLDEVAGPAFVGASIE